jgi:AraC-like DNA-binding protein
VALLLDTRSVAPEDRREAWAAAHATALFPLSIDFAGGAGPFVGRAEGHAMGALRLMRLRGDASIVRRTPRTIRAADPGVAVLALALAGSCAVEQDGSHVTLRPGDLTTWVSSRPFRIAHDSRIDLLLVSAPVDEIGLRRPRTAHVSGTSGPGAIVRSFLRELWGQLPSQASLAASPEWQDALLSMTRAVHRGEGAPAPAAPGALAARARAYAERHLGDPSLDPAALADAHHVSQRRLFAAFAADGDTPSAWIRRRRLQRCRDDLRDPACAHLTIAQIALRWGFANHAHFSRAFKARYGSTPRETRDRGD